MTFTSVRIFCSSLFFIGTTFVGSSQGSTDPSSCACVPQLSFTTPDTPFLTSIYTPTSFEQPVPLPFTSNSVSVNTLLSPSEGCVSSIVSDPSSALIAAMIIKFVTSPTPPTSTSATPTYIPGEDILFMDPSSENGPVLFYSSFFNPQSGELEVTGITQAQRYILSLDNARYTLLNPGGQGEEESGGGGGGNLSLKNLSLTLYSPNGCVSNTLTAFIIVVSPPSPLRPPPSSSAVLIPKRSPIPVSSPEVVPVSSSFPPPTSSSSAAAPAGRRSETCRVCALIAIVYICIFVF